MKLTNEQAQEIKDQQSQEYKTKRVTAPELEKILYEALPDIWEGMSGTWMGKNYSGLIDIMNIFSIDNKKEVFNLLKVAEREASKYYAEKQKQQESLSKAKRGR